MLCLCGIPELRLPLVLTVWPMLGLDHQLFAEPFDGRLPLQAFSGCRGEPISDHLHVMITACLRGG